MRKSHYVQLVNSLLAVTSAILLSGCDYLKDAAIAERYMAKNICTGLFVSQFPEQTLVQDYILPMMPPVKPYWNIRIDRDQKTVHVSDKIFGETYAADAIYQPPLGCVLAFNHPTETLRQAVPAGINANYDSTQAWPQGDQLFPAQIAGVNYDGLTQSVDDMFTDTADKKIQTVAVLVVQDEKLIMERYAPTTTKNTVIKGFSASKSALGAVIGAAYDKGLIQPEAATGIRQWRGTVKQNISIKNLLQMASGLKHSEIAVGKNNDQGHVLYGVPHPADAAALEPLINSPGDVFNYSSANTALLSQIVQDAVGGRDELYKLYRNDLFLPAGMHSARFENDTTGYISGAEGALMTAQDWARLAWLYLNNGQIMGTQVLSQNWIQFTRTPSSAEQDYGALLVLNTTQSQWPDLPADSFEFIGAMGQHVVGIPSRKTVIVRLGFTYDLEKVDVNQFAAAILANLP